MRVVGLLILTVVLHAAVFAQKLPDPEARNKRAVSVAPTRPANSVQILGSRPAATSVPKSGSSSARDLAKIERASIQQMKTTRKKTASSSPGPQVMPGTQPQTKTKPIKFSFQPPKTGGGTSGRNTSPPATQSRKPH